VGIIVYNTVPLMRETMNILMHATPQDVNLEGITSALFNLEGVVDVHDVHVWSLTPGTVIGTAHLILRPGVNHSTILDKAKGFLHSMSIHSSVIQIEFAKDDNWKSGKSSCYDMLCEEEIETSVGLCCQSKSSVEQ